MTGAAPRISRAAFGLLIGSSIFSIIGMLLLRFSPAAVSKAGAMLPWLIKVPTWIFMFALPVFVLAATLRFTGWARGMALLGWASLVGLGAELLGTTSGLPFGAYTYGDILGAKMFGHVPVSIPTSWYAAAMMCAVLAARFSASTGGRIVLASLFMVLWDVTLDPAMSYGFPAWTWGVDGMLYGMPLSNFAGWFVTSLVIMAVLVPLLKDRVTDMRWAVALWLGSSFLPLGISVVREMWLAVVLAVPAIAVPLVPWRRLFARGETQSRSAVLVEVREGA